MKRLKLICITLLSSFVLMISFQNCSKVQATAIDELAGQKADALGSADDDGSQSSSDDGSGGNGNGGNQASGGSDPGANGSDEDFVAYCEGLGKRADEAVSAADKASFSDVHGNFFIKAAHLTNLSDITGNIHLFGTVADSSIDSISDMHGNMIICGMDIKEVKSFTSGHLVVVGGDIGSVDGFSGNIRLVGGKVGSFTNFNGNFASR